MSEYLTSSALVSCHSTHDVWDETGGGGEGVRRDGEWS